MPIINGIHPTPAEHVERSRSIDSMVIQVLSSHYSMINTSDNNISFKPYCDMWNCRDISLLIPIEIKGTIGIVGI